MYYLLKLVFFPIWFPFWLFGKFLSILGMGLLGRAIWHSFDD